MNAIELFLKDGLSSGLYFCGKCRCVCATQTIAERCCQNYKCAKCGKDTGSRRWINCDECRDAEEAAKELARFEKAEKLTSWSGCICTSDDRFYSSIENYLDINDGEEFPEYVWTCKANQFVKVDIDNLLQNIEENGYEDFDSSTLDGLKELEAACKAFEEANAAVLMYEPDYTKAVLITKNETK